MDFLLKEALEILNRISAGEILSLSYPQIAALKESLSEVADIEQLEEPDEGFLDLKDASYDQIGSWFAADALLNGNRFRAWVRDDGTLKMPKSQDDRFWGINYIFSETTTRLILIKALSIGRHSKWQQFGDNEYSKGRGLQQALADLVTHVALEAPDDKWLHSVIRRVQMGYWRVADSEARLEIIRNMDEAGISFPNKPTAYASVPPNTFYQMVELIFDVQEE